MSLDAFGIFETHPAKDKAKVREVEPKTRLDKMGRAMCPRPREEQEHPRPDQIEESIIALEDDKEFIDAYRKEYGLRPNAPAWKHRIRLTSRRR